MDRWVGDRWATAYYPILPACLSPVIRIEPGATFSGRIGIFAGFPGTNWEPKFQVANPEGTYRIVLETLSSFDKDAYPFGPLIPQEHRVSNQFRLVTADQQAD